MKLKRFLLRYDPPGVGLEVEVDGTSEVRHKDLPASNQVRSLKEIKAVVDEMISSDPDLLLKKRHRNALIQLLGRLYQVDVEEHGEEADGGAQTPEPEGDKSSLQEGQVVLIVGLQGKQQVINGEYATVIKARPEKSKYEVELAGKAGEPGEVLKFKGLEHTVPLAPKGTSLAMNVHVAIRGLRNHIELNGCLGRIVECHPESQRYEVRAADSGQLFRVKQDNLIPVDGAHAAFLAAAGASKENHEPNAGAAAVSPRERPKASGHGQQESGDVMEDTFEVGSIVQLMGLKTAQQFNGQNAEILAVDRQRGRYEIRLADGSVKTIRAENVRLIMNAKDARSPRGKKKESSTTVPPLAGASRQR